MSRLTDAIGDYLPLPGWRHAATALVFIATLLICQEDPKAYSLAIALAVSASALALVHAIGEAITGEEE
jgi:hypothetical protein